MLKRLLIGRRVASDRAEHALLPKWLGLPVFSSDALSSVAYATEEILAVLLPVALVAGANAYGLVMPIAIAIALLLAVVIMSYRQTIRAYPRGAGAYFVSKDNLGTNASLLAGASLLIDYTLTVSVSITAGVLAVTSMAKGDLHEILYSNKVWIALAFIAFVTVMNIRGVKESGSVFAIPTYAFIGLIYITVVAGLSQCAFGGGCPRIEHVEMAEGLVATATTISFFVILRAFASGATALTGVEAISDGITAFRRPQWRNAQITITIMGCISVSMFLGISFLATQGHAVKSEEQTVVAQIAYAVFNGGFMFYLVQAFTAAILILAANTAYQDFPRLASFLARDRFMPRQFLNRGDRLVFSNGIVGLAFLAGFLIWVFDANLERLIHLYVLGVFTSFTLSQLGMVRHWRREGRKGEAAEDGWRRSLIINLIGGTTTGVVAVVVLFTKFAPEGLPKPGAWMVIIAALIQIGIFKSIHRHYTSVNQQLRRAYTSLDAIPANHMVLVVTGLDAPTAEAIGYIRATHPIELACLWIGRRVPEDLQERWREFAPGLPPLEILEREGSGLLRPVRAYLRSHPRHQLDFLTVIVPEVVKDSLFVYLLRRWQTIRLKVKLLREPNLVVTSVPFLPGIEEVHTGLEHERVEALVFISNVHNATVRAVNYARSLKPASIRAVHIALDPENTAQIVEDWAATGLPVMLEVVEAPFRDLTRPMLEEIERATARPGSLASVVLPQFVVSRWRHWPLHNQDALFVKRTLLYQPKTILSSVPYRLED